MLWHRMWATIIDLSGSLLYKARHVGLLNSIHTLFLLPLSRSDGGKPRSRLDAEGSPQHEDPQQRLRWQAHLEFTHNHAVGDLTWELIDPVLPRSERLRSLVLGGIPHSMRPQVGGGSRQRDPLISTRRCQRTSFPGSFGCVCPERCRRRGPLRYRTEKSSRTAPATTPPRLNR